MSATTPAGVEAPSDPAAPPFRLVPYFVGTFIDTVGGGLWMPIALIFFVRAQGLPLGQVGAALTLGGIVALAVGPLAGTVSDRIGPVPVVFASNAVRVLVFCCYPLVGSVWQLLVLATLGSAGDRLFWTANTPLMSRLAEGRALDRMLATQSVVRIVGLGVGAGAAGLLADRPGGLELLAYANAASFALAAVLVLVAAGGFAVERAGRGGHGSGAAVPGWRSVARDRPFLLLCGIHTVLALGGASLVLILPLVAVDTLRGPVWLAGAAIVLGNAVLAVAQRPVVAWTGPRPRRRGLVAGALVLATAFLLLAPAGHASPEAVVGLVLAAAAVGALGQCAAFPLMVAAANHAAPVASRGRYSAVFQTSWGAANAVAPALLTGLLAVGHPVLWLTLAAATLATVPALRAVSTRLPAACLRE